MFTGTDEGAALANTTSETLSAIQSLTVLVTLESLLFAGFNLGLALAVPVAQGRNISQAGAYRLALGVAVSLTLIALGALLAWWQVFVDHWPTSALRAYQALAIALGISVQPIVTFVAAHAIKPPESGS
jgi:hypothetical protein